MLHTAGDKLGVFIPYLHRDCFCMGDKVQTVPRRTASVGLIDREAISCGEVS